jgi:hypothetical protein
VTAISASQHEDPPLRVGPPALQGRRSYFTGTWKCACTDAMNPRGPSLEGSIYPHEISLCVPYISGFMLSAVAPDLHPCSAVTSSATRWTEPPP